MHIKRTSSFALFCFRRQILYHKVGCSFYFLFNFPTKILRSLKKDISYLLRKTLLDKDKNGNEYDRGWIDGIHNSIAAVENSKDFQELLLNVHNLGGTDGEPGYDKGWDDSITEALSIIEISVGLSIDEVLDYSGEKAVASEIHIEKNNEQTNIQEEKEEEESIAAKGLKI